MDARDVLDRALAKAGTKGRLAEVAGVSRRQVARWFNEGKDPGAQAYGALLSYLGTSVSEVRRAVAERAMGAH